MYLNSKIRVSMNYSTNIAKLYSFLEELMDFIGFLVDYIVTITRTELPAAYSLTRISVKYSLRFSKV